MSALGFQPITLASALFVLGFAGMLLMAFNALSERDRTHR